MGEIVKSNGQLSYKVYGSGPIPLLAFHGFGQDKHVYAAWSKKLSKRYTIYAIDVFYHGNSHRKEAPLSKSEWKDWMVALLEQEQIETFATLGYSLGGRFSIATTLAFPSRILEINLVAPDAVYLTPWFKLATTPGLRSVFKYLMMHPTRLERLLSFNEKSKLVNKYVADFARKEMGSYENRRRVYLSWNHFKPLGYTQNQLIRGLNEINVQKRLVIGDKDHIITPAGILPIIKKMNGFEVHSQPLKHHQLIRAEVADFFA